MTCSKSEKIGWIESCETGEPLDEKPLYKKIEEVPSGAKREISLLPEVTEEPPDDIPDYPDDPGESPGIAGAHPEISEVQRANLPESPAVPGKQRANFPEVREVPGKWRVGMEGNGIEEKSTEEKKEKEKKEVTPPIAPKGGPPGGSVENEKAFEVVFPENLNTERFRKAWESWIAYRREIKLKAWQQRTVESCLRKMAEWGEETSCQSIQESISNGWQGLFHPKAANPYSKGHVDVAKNNVSSRFGSW